ncbi:hypothetical protein HJA85_25160 [Rhizobium bangladeshense]|uniref:hypothetical protein n=1 Tax=Rhizobium bangladeshense TaxID=1138189 RepID=UPI001C836B5E|nr:hypothetical protein [Rhizobium bangladeshense]MBX4870230.1 hypothetical protein [Rhizobium bangladeshense]
MTLLSQLKADVLDVLAPRGWAELFLDHGLDITVSLDKLNGELTKPLSINRGVRGFEEFSLAGIRAIESGSPGRSLLYHALAFPGCNVTGAGRRIEKFPSLQQLDIVENVVYSVAHASLSNFRDPVLAIFAYQYRERSRTTHRKHADMVFSRTGISRVGDHEAFYNGEWRSYEPNPGKGRTGFRVLPARYGLFVAERRVRGEEGTVLRPTMLDAELTFLFPVHKVFEGKECLYRNNDDSAVPLEIGPILFKEEHINEKLARIHDRQGGENDAYIRPHPTVRFDRNSYPFRRSSKTDPSLVSLTTLGSTCQIVPSAGPIVENARQTVTGRDEIVRFQVPKVRKVRGRPNRYWSTFEITANGNSRAAPEYVNIRHEVASGKKAQIVDLNLLPSKDFREKVLEKGGYDAAHFIDHTCDGAISATVASGVDLPVHCAYSLVSALDYFPLVDQVEVEEWLEIQQAAPTGLANVGLTFPQGGPQPMSDGRFEWDGNGGSGGIGLTYQLPNCALNHPQRPGRKAFGLEDPCSFTTTAIVGAPATAPCLPPAQTSPRSVTWLPDSASDVFAPGWDVSQHQRDGRNMMVSYGLGSPFPEDAKLCAALNSFWPAVAPDSSRTYGVSPPRANAAQRVLFTSLPLTDSELGYHPDHPRVQAGEVETCLGWDGDFGPFIHTETDGNYAFASNPLRADQTSATFAGRANFAGLDRVSTEEFITRIYALSWLRENCEDWCRRRFDRVLNHRRAGWWLVTYERIENWEAWASSVLPRADKSLTSEGHLFVFVQTGDGNEFEAPPTRLRYEVKARLEIQISGLGLCKPSQAPDQIPKFVFLKKDSGIFEELK